MKTSSDWCGFLSKYCNVFSFLYTDSSLYSILSTRMLINETQRTSFTLLSTRWRPRITFARGPKKVYQRGPVWRRYLGTHWLRAQEMHPLDQVTEPTSKYEISLPDSRHFLKCWFWELVGVSKNLPCHSLAILKLLFEWKLYSMHCMPRGAAGRCTGD